MLTSAAFRDICRALSEAHLEPICVHVTPANRRALAAELLPNGLSDGSTFTISALRNHLTGKSVTLETNGSLRDYELTVTPTDT